MEEIREYQDYKQFKEAVDAELQRTAEGFVRIGYLLKVARDTDILKESGYETVNDFAKAEYGIERTQVSRFININDRFSENGFSDRLLPEYQGMGYAKLAIMLTLPDSINQELTPDYSKSEIQAVKEEYEAEQKRTDIEVLLEGTNPDTEQMNNLEKAVFRLLHDTPELIEEYMHIIDLTERMGLAIEDKDIYELLAPAGQMMYSIRMQGIGRVFLSVNNDKLITLTNVRTGEKNAYPLAEVREQLHTLIGDMAGVMYEDIYMRLYNEPYPVKETEKAPEAAKTANTKPLSEPKKTKVQKSPQIAPVQQPRSAEIANGKASQEESSEETQIGQQDDQIQGQESIETMDDGKYMSLSPMAADASVDGQKVDAEIEENVENTECGGQSEDDLKRAAGGTIRMINIALANRDYKDMQLHTEKLLEIAKTLNKKEEN